MARIAIVGGELPTASTDHLASKHDVAHLSRDEFLDGDANVLADIEGVILIGQPPVTEVLLDRAPRLRVVSVRAVGYDKVDVEACRRRGIDVCHTPGVLTRAVADLASVLIVGLARHLGEAIRFANAEWPSGRRPDFLGSNVAGQTLGVVGLGRIGKEVARTCANGFGMQIAYSRPSGPDPSLELPGPGWMELPDLLAVSDIVTLHAPLTPSTRHLIGADELAQMKPGALIVNTSRGGLVDEHALLHSLESGHLGGAALDTLDPEPPRPDHPLLRMPNVILTPHVGSGTAETRAAMADLAVANLLQVLDGDEPPARVPELQGERTHAN